MTEPAWYLRCTPDQVGERAILVGDRGRVRVAADLLDDPEWMNEDRGLTTVTGRYAGKRITVSAFGMGAPIAVIVLHELARLGVRSVLRVGTVLGLPPAGLGSLVLAEGGVRGETTSRTYVPLGFPAVPATELNQALLNRLRQQSRPWLSGLVASYDGFYTEIFGIEPERAAHIDRTSAELNRMGVVAMDMETSALLAVGRTLGVHTASLCLASVDGRTHERMPEADRAAAERDLVGVGLAALADLPDRPANGPA